MNKSIKKLISFFLLFAIVAALPAFAYATNPDRFFIGDPFYARFYLSTAPIQVTRSSEWADTQDEAWREAVFTVPMGTTLYLEATMFLDAEVDWFIGTSAHPIDWHSWPPIGGIRWSNLGAFNRRVILNFPDMYRIDGGKQGFFYVNVVDLDAPPQLPPIPPPSPANNIRVLLNGSAVTMDVPPMLADGRTFVPLRAIGEAIGAEFEWDSAAQRVTFEQGGMTAVLHIGDILIDTTDAHGNRLTRFTDAPPFITDGRTLVPLRVISEIFGYEVNWNGETRTVTIDS
ncbi:MAG: copper amine oxidase N-terminal domain-containing protein [Oscillospiraceae bacterium]|nr:copper amine oxidase N-terminal domain-containing protein [Oscillospiraceae bacterium]